MANPDRLPAKTADLLALLDHVTPHPAWPTNPDELVDLSEAGMRKRIWTAAQRALVDALLAQLDAEALEEAQEAMRDAEEEPSSDDGDPYGAFPRVLGKDHRLHQITSPVPMDESGA